MCATAIRGPIAPILQAPYTENRGRNTEKKKKKRKLLFCPSPSPVPYSRAFSLNFSAQAPYALGLSMSCCLPFSMSSSSSSRDGVDHVAGESQGAKKERRMLASSLYIQVSPEKVGVFSIGHPFDSAKRGRSQDFLANEDVVDASKIVVPAEATKVDQLVVKI